MTGPRNCIGQRFALAELKIVLAFMLRSFRFESLEHRDKILANMEMVLRPKVPLNVKIYKRSKEDWEASLILYSFDFGCLTNRYWSKNHHLLVALTLSKSFCLQTTKIWYYYMRSDVFFNKELCTKLRHVHQKLSFWCILGIILVNGAANYLVESFKRRIKSIYFVKTQKYENTTGKCEEITLKV